MPEGPDGKTIIIVKKVSGHGGHHGGAWKVAYADFVTAMMALFMVLWLVNSASVTTREAIATYFKRPGVFEKGSGTPLEIGGGGILGDTFAPPAESDSQIAPNKKIYKDEEGEEIPSKLTKEQEQQHAKEEVNFEKIATELEKSIEANKKAVDGFLGNVGIKVDQRGLHLEIMDTATTSMFSVGSSQVLGEAQETLLKIATILGKLPNPIDIEGHTDATPFRASTKERYDNWNLSADRANAARRVLEAAGLQSWQIARVVGYADKRPKAPDDPFNPSNRRITISMRYTEQAAAALSGKQVVETAPKPMPAVKDEGIPGTSSREAVEKAPPVKTESLPLEKTPPVIENPVLEKPVLEKVVPPYIKELQDLTKKEKEEKAAATQALPVSPELDKEKLHIEIEATLPEGPPLNDKASLPVESNASEEAPTPPAGAPPGWQSEDKIFGNENPFTP